MTTLTRIFVPGMTGSDCVSAVTKHLKTVPGCGQMTVQLNGADDAIVSIMSAEPLDDAATRAAIADAGYSVNEIVVVEDALAQQMAEQAPARQALRNPYRSDPNKA